MFYSNEKLLMLWIKETIGINHMFLTIFNILSNLLLTLDLYHQDIFLFFLYFLFMMYD